MEKTLLSPEEKERLAFRAEMLTLLGSISELVADIHEHMLVSEEDHERNGHKKQLGDYIDSNRKIFSRYLREARKLPDDEELFSKDLPAIMGKF